MWDAIPKWLFSAAFAVLVVLIAYLAVTGYELRYDRGIQFVKDGQYDSKGPDVLAIARVYDGRLVSSTEGVSFDLSKGIISFPNPKNRRFVPLVSDTTNNSYITQMHFIKDIVEPNQFTVWRKTLDNTSRTEPPEDFTVIVVGF